VGDGRAGGATDLSDLYLDIINRGRHLKHYSVISIMPRCVFALSQNALALLGSVIAFIIYRSRHIAAVIASYSYCSEFIDQRYRFYVIVYLLLSSPIRLNKELKGDEKKLF
jgi:hypothetical protein